MSTTDPQAAPPETDLRDAEEMTVDLSGMSDLAVLLYHSIRRVEWDEGLDTADDDCDEYHAPRRRTTAQELADDIEAAGYRRPDALRTQIADEIRGMDAKALYDVFWKAKPNGATTFEEWRCKQIAAMAETIAQSVEARTATVTAAMEDVGIRATDASLPSSEELSEAVRTSVRAAMKGTK
jgi:hypothetical protein